MFPYWVGSWDVIICRPYGPADHIGRGEGTVIILGRVGVTGGRVCACELWEAARVSSSVYMEWVQIVKPSEQMAIKLRDVTLSNVGKESFKGFTKELYKAREIYNRIDGQLTFKMDRH